MFFISLTILVINTGSEGPDLVDFLEVPKMFQQLLQSIRNKSQINTLKNKEQPTKKLFAVFRALLDPILGLIRPLI